MPDILFHYCSNESLLSIIKNKSIYLTIATAANDSEETRRGRMFVEEVLSKHQTEPEHQWIIDLHGEKTKLAVPPYIACFSENGDQLSQWRGYADDATGVSIGFKKNSFEIKDKLPSPFDIVEEAHSAGWGKVIYDHDLQRRMIEQVIKDYITRRKAAPEKLEIILSTVTEIWQLALIFKNPGFSEENEWRIINTPLLMALKSGAPLQLVGAIGKRVSRMKGKQIVTSIEMPLIMKSGHEPIVEVVLGPKNPTQEYDLKNLFHEHGFVNVKIRRSRISYR